MANSLQSAKNKSKGIVKVQINTGQQQIFPDHERAVLVYDEQYKRSGGNEGVKLVMPLTKGLDEAMGSKLKRYFYYRINKKGFMKRTKELQLLHEAPAQSW